MLCFVHSLLQTFCSKHLYNTNRVRIGLSFVLVVYMYITIFWSSHTYHTSKVDSVSIVRCRVLQRHHQCGILLCQADTNDRNWQQQNYTQMVPHFVQKVKFRKITNTPLWFTLRSKRRFASMTLWFNHNNVLSHRVIQLNHWWWLLTWENNNSWCLW